MLIRQILIALLLATLSLGSVPGAESLLSVDDSSAKHRSEQPLKDSEEETEKSKTVFDDLEVLFCGVLIADIEHLPTIRTDRYDETISFSQSVLSSPDHSRAPPANC